MTVPPTLQLHVISLQNQLAKHVQNPELTQQPLVTYIWVIDRF